jgi:hypothetical protein
MLTVSRYGVKYLAALRLVNVPDRGIPYLSPFFAGFWLFDWKVLI